MANRIHIFGASGSGTTTLGSVLARELNCQHFDSDDYFWMPTEPKFEVIRQVSDRQERLAHDLQTHSDWVLSGSLCRWGDFTIPMYSLVIYLWIPPEIRMERLHNREVQRYGPAIVEKSHPRNRGYNDFMTWAAKYDTGGLDMRSKARHEAWIKSLPGPVLRLEGALAIPEKIARILDSGFIESPSLVYTND